MVGLFWNIVRLLRNEALLGEVSYGGKLLKFYRTEQLPVLTLLPRCSCNENNYFMHLKACIPYHVGGYLLNCKTFYVVNCCQVFAHRSNKPSNMTLHLHITSGIQFM